MKKSILIKLTVTVMVCLFAISNTMGQVTGDPHAVLVGSEYTYTVTKNGSNTYEWAVIDGVTTIPLVGVTNSIDVAWEGVINTDFTDFITNTRSVILQVKELQNHGDGAICTQISQIAINFTNTLPSIVMQTADYAICSMEATSVIVKFNGIAPWDITLTDDQSVVTVSETNITMAQVTDIGGGFYTYTFNINAGILDATAGDITHNLEITSFVDDNVRKNASFTNGDLTGDVDANVTVHQLPQISTITHN